MKKKIVTILLALCLCCSATACGGNIGSDKEQKSSSSSETTVENKVKKDNINSEESPKEENGISSEKNLFSVEVTFPASLLGDSGELELTDEVKDKGVKDVTKNADGSVTFKMTKDAHKKFLALIKSTVDEAINTLLTDNENYPSFNSISYNDDMTVFDVKVDPAVYGGVEIFSAFAFYMYGNMYQALNTVPENELKTVVNFINKDTGEVIESGDSTALNELPTE